MPLLDSLRDVRDSMDYSRFTDVLQTIIDDIEGGKTLSLALSDHKQIFDKVYVTLVRVGEETGRLPEVLKDLAETLRWQDELAAHTRPNHDLPAIVTIVVLAVVSFLMIYLMPQLMPFIKNIGGEIPTHTKILIATSAIFVDYWYIIFISPVVVVAPDQIYRNYITVKARYVHRRYQTQAVAVWPVVDENKAGEVRQLFCHDVQLRYNRA